MTNVNFSNVAAKFTMLSISTGSIYILLILIYLLAHIYKFFRLTSHHEKSTKYSNLDSNITYKRKFFMFFYVTFRVFYTFLFTLSVGFSLFLGIDSQGKELSNSNNQFFTWIRQESKQINQFTISELRRHLQYSSNLKRACENQDQYKIRRLELEMVSSLNNSLYQWYSLPSKSVFNETMLFINNKIAMYYGRLKQISEKLNYNIQSRFYDRYGQYQQLLKEYYYLTYFLLVQTVHNDSKSYTSDWNFDKHNETFVQKFLIDFLGFLSVYEPMSLNTIGLQNLNKLNSNFRSLIKNKTRWTDSFKLQNSKVTKRATAKLVHRMFYTKILLYNRDNLILTDLYQHNVEKKSYKTITSFKIIQTRIFLVVLDCFIVIYRFYNTFEVLKWMWLGKKTMVYNDISTEVKSKIFTECPQTLNRQVTTNPSPRLDHRITSPRNISLRIITNNQYPDWLAINHYQPSFNFSIKVQRLMRIFGQIHFVTAIITVALLMMLLVVVVVIHYLYLKHYNPDSVRTNVAILERMQPLVNGRLKHIAEYVNNHILKNAKIHNINMSSLIINSSYVMSHIQRSVCHQLSWEMKSIRERSNTLSTLPVDICRLQSDVNFLPYLLVHISPCQFLDVLPINYTLSSIFYDKSLQRSTPIRKIHHVVFLLICIVVSTTTAIGSIHLFCNIVLKAVLKSTDHCRYVMMTPFYPHNASFKIHSSSSHSTQSGRNVPIIETNGLLRSPVPTVTGGHFSNYPTSLLHYQLTATSESDV